jgi:hypothetical protein
MTRGPKIPFSDFTGHLFTEPFPVRVETEALYRLVQTEVVSRGHLAPDEGISSQSRIPHLTELLGQFDIRGDAFGLELDE